MNTILLLASLLACIYIICESLSVAAAADSGERFCVFLRYLITVAAGLIGAHDVFWYWWLGLEPDYRAIVFIWALFFSCWSRMVYRLFGNRRRGWGGR